MNPNEVVIKSEQHLMDYLLILRSSVWNVNCREKR